MKMGVLCADAKTPNWTYRTKEENSSAPAEAVAFFLRKNKEENSSAPSEAVAFFLQKNKEELHEVE